MARITRETLFEVVRKLSKHLGITTKNAFSLVSDLMPPRASNTRSRASSSNNAIAKDWASSFAERWTSRDQQIKDRIFAGIIEEGRCAYCGERIIKGHQESDHFIPTSSRTHNLYGADNSGNKFTVCRSCNSTKGSSHPQYMINLLKQKGDIRRAMAFQIFLNQFETKLTLSMAIVEKIQIYQSKMDKYTRQFCLEMEKDMLTYNTGL